MTDIDAFAHRFFYTQTFLHTDAFTHRRFYTQKFLHTGAFTHRDFYTQTLLHTNAFTHRRFYTYIVEAFTHRPFCTQTLFHTDAFTKKFLHTEAFTHFAGQLGNRNFTSVLGDRTSFHAKGLRLDKKNAIVPQFLTIGRSNLIVPKGCDWTRGIAIVPQFLTIEPHFVPKGLRLDKRNRNFTIVFDLCERVRGTTCKSQLYPQFLAIDPHFVRHSFFGDGTSFGAKGFTGQLANRNFTTFFLAIDLISCERVRGATWKSQFYISFWRSNLILCERETPTRDDLQIFGDRSSFRAKGLRFAPSRYVGTAPCLRERNRMNRIRINERAKGQAAREQEGKREDVKMRRCEDVKM